MQKSQINFDLLHNFAAFSAKSRKRIAINPLQTLMEPKTYIDHIYEIIIQYGLKVIAGLIMLVVGLWIIHRITAAFRNFLKRRNVDDSLRPFLISMADVALKVALLLMVAGQLGIETTSFIAVFSAMAFAVGLALQGSLGNFASGVLILLFKPYKVGDLLTVEDKVGFVAEIQIFNTVLTTEHGKTIIIPNSKMTEGAIENVVRDAEIQSEISLLLDSDNNLGLVREAVEAAAQRCPWRLPERDTEVVITGLSRDDMKADVSWWSLGENYIRNMDFMYEALREEFASRGIKMAKERRRETL
ncbi:MAG: mechanosensitive ion channel [Lewinellaceae bacterium]|nr:mechanosensitive ion channel [Lewinellaceae bacterium]